MPRPRIPSPSRAPAPIGSLLREWRTARRLSQLGLALEADVSARHLSYVETGKAQASRDMVSRLADALDMSLRERNTLLLAAGYAPEFPETSLDTAELAPVRRAIDFILDHQEPYPAFVVNRRWDILRANRGAERVGQFLMEKPGHDNMVRQIFDPNDLRAVVANWEEVARDLIHHLHDDMAAAPTDPKAKALLEEALSYPGVPAAWRTRELTTPPRPLLTTAFRKNGQELTFFSTITRFGTSRDVTVEELRIECTFPADEGTAEFCKKLGG